MLFRVAGAGDAKVAAALHECSQFSGVPEATLLGDERSGTLRRIAAQRDDVLHAARLELIEHERKLAASRAHAREMGHGFDADLALNAPDQVDRELARAAAGAVRDRDVSRRERRQVGDGREQAIHAFLVLRRKELEGDGGARSAELIHDLHDAQPNVAVTYRPCQKACLMNPEAQLMRIHVVAVAGTGIRSALAGLLVELGHQVSGSDVAFDPPIGPALSEWGVKTLVGFDPAHLVAAAHDLVVIGNVRVGPTTPKRARRSTVACRTRTSQVRSIASCSKARHHWSSRVLTTAKRRPRRSPPGYWRAPACVPDS